MVQLLLKSEEEVDREMNMLTGNHPQVLKKSRKSRPGDENIDGKLSGSC